MSLTGIYCADPKFRRKDELHEVSIPDCLACAATRENPCHFTLELLRSLYASVQDRGERISTTTLTAKCQRQRYFDAKREYALKPEQLWPAWWGTNFHTEMEVHGEEPTVCEARFFVWLDGLGEMSGSPDTVDVPNGILGDYKFPKEVPRFNYPWEDHIEQCQVNRWLVDHAYKVVYRGEEHRLVEDDGTINEDVRARFVPKQWTRLEVVYADQKGPKPLTITKSVDVPKKDGKGTKKVRVPDIWPDDRVEALIRGRYAELRMWLDEEKVPPQPWDWTHPLCQWCPHMAVCIEQHYRENPVVTPVTIGATVDDSHDPFAGLPGSEVPAPAQV